MEYTADNKTVQINAHRFIEHGRMGITYDLVKTTNGRKWRTVTGMQISKVKVLTRIKMTFSEWMQYIKFNHNGSTEV